MYVFSHPDDMDSQSPYSDRYQTEDEAVRAALAHQRDYPFNGLLAVYDRRSSVVLVLIHHGIVYRPD